MAPGVGRGADGGVYGRTAGSVNRCGVGGATGRRVVLELVHEQEALPADGPTVSGRADGVAQGGHDLVGPTRAARRVEPGPRDTVIGRLAFDTPTSIEQGPEVVADGPAALDPVPRQRRRRATRGGRGETRGVHGPASSIR